MTATANIVHSIDNRLSQLKEEINTLTAARAALAGHDSSATRQRQANSTRAARPQNNGASRHEAVRPLGNPAARQDSGPTHQKSPQLAKRTRRQKRRPLQNVSAEQLELLLSEHGDLSTSSLAEHANVNRDQILTRLRELEASGRIRRTGQRRSTRWHAITDEERIQERAAELAARSKSAH